MSKGSPNAFGAVAILAFAVIATAISDTPAQETPGGPAIEPGPPSVTASLEPGGGGTAGGPTESSIFDVRPTMLVGCMGSSDAPDLFLRNIGNVTIPAGTAVTLLLPQGRRESLYITPEDIKPGQVLDVSSILARAIGKDQVCLSVLRR